MPLRERFDRVMLGTLALYATLGLVVLGSASWVVAAERYGKPPYYFLMRQLVALVLGLLLMVFAMHLRLKVVTDPRVVWAGTLVLLAAAAATFFEPPIAGTYRWLRLGPFSVQPSLLLTFWMVVVASKTLPEVVRYQRPKDIGKLAGAVLAALAVVYLQKDLGAAVVMGAVLLMLAYLAGVSARVLAPVVAAGVIMIALAIASSPYRAVRIKAFFSPGEASLSAGWQMRQSLIALGSGGMLGRGFGLGQQKLFFLPEPHTDFILSIVGEELGFVGVLGLLGLCGVLTWRAMVTARKQSSPERALLAAGLGLVFTLQWMLHAAVCMGMVPAKGMPLPLVSYARTETVATLAAFGLLLNLSREVPV